MKLLFIGIFTYITFSSFLQPYTISEPGANLKQDSTSLSGDWYLVPVLASDTATGKLPVLHFNIGQKKFTGFTGCNQVSGVFTLQANQLQFGKDLQLTKIACEGFNEKEFIINLLRVDHYSITNGILTLTIDKTPISKWMRKRDNKGVI